MKVTRQIFQENPEGQCRVTGLKLLRESKWFRPRFQEKPLSFRYGRPYPKPTQVDEESILRRLRQLG